MNRPPATNSGAPGQPPKANTSQFKPVCPAADVPNPQPHTDPVPSSPTSHPPPQPSPTGPASTASPKAQKNITINTGNANESDVKRKSDERQLRRRSSKTAGFVREKIAEMIGSPSTLQRAASQVFGAHDKNQDRTLQAEEIKSCLSDLSKQFNIPEPDEKVIAFLFAKFDNSGSRELTKAQFEKFYKFVLCWIRDQYYPAQMRFRRDFFIQTKKISLDSVYERQEKLGQGQFGIVFKVKDKRTGMLRCCKCISKSKSAVPAEFIQNEINILKALDHPNIVKLYECYEDYNNLYLIFELISGEELLQVLLKRGKEGRAMSEREAARLLKAILSAVSHCHANRVMHKDLKPENIMVLGGDKGVSTAAIKIIDFGLAEMFTPGVVSTTAAGTPYYMAPEVFNHRFNYKCDVWSAGVLLYLMLTAHLPFDANSKEEYIQVVNNHSVSFPRELFKHISREAQDFIKILLTRDVERRPSASQAMGNKWFTLFDDEDPVTNERCPAKPGESTVHRGIGGADKAKDPVDPETAAEIANPLRRLSKRGSKFLKFARQTSFKRICLNVVAMNMHYTSVSRAPEVFRALDTDHDGCLSEEDLARGLRDLGVAEDQIVQIVDALDADDSGEISYTEFVAALVDASSEEFEQQLWAVFRQFDLNMDGKITKDELLQLLQSGGLAVDGKLRGKTRSVDQMMLDLDKNGDGMVTFDEFATYLRSDVYTHVQPNEKDRPDSEHGLVTKRTTQT